MILNQWLDRIVCMDALAFLRELPDNAVHCLVTSPPYYALRNYNVDGQIGLERTPADYVAALVAVFEEARRVLRDDGTMWVNLGDSYTGGGGYAPNAPSNQNGGSLSSRSVGEAGGRTSGAIRFVEGLPPKSLLGIPWRVAFALQDAGFILRSEIIWSKPNPMPESVIDRPTKAHETVFLLAKSCDAQFWIHRDHAGTRQQPQPDYRWIHHDTRVEVAVMPDHWDHDENVRKLWKRINLWQSADYWYDGEAIREPLQSWKIINGEWQCTDGGGKAGKKQKVANKYPGMEGKKLSGNMAEGKRIVPNEAGRNKRTVWTVPTEPTPFAHFATFPQKLIEPMILAGCPAKCCAVCGAGWVRVTEITPEYQGVKDKLRQRLGPDYHMKRAGLDAIKGQGTGGNPATLPPKNITLGFRPTCTCNADTRPGVVLDIFGGSGTVGLVARRLGRSFILSDLNLEYCELARKRLAHNADSEVQKQEKGEWFTMPMFE